MFHSSVHQWPFQEPELEVPTIYKAYCSGLCEGLSPQNAAKNMVQYLHLRIHVHVLFRGSLLYGDTPGDGANLQWSGQGKARFLLCFPGRGESWARAQAMASAGGVLKCGVAQDLLIDLGRL